MKLSKLKKYIWNEYFIAGVIILVIFLSLWSLVSVFNSGYKTSYLIKTALHLTQPAPTSAPTPTPITHSDYLKVYKTKYYRDADKFFTDNLNIVYKDLIPTDEALLTPITCTKNYHASNMGIDSGVWYDGKRYKLEPEIVNIISSIEIKYPKNKLNEITACTSSSRKTIVMYILGPCGGGCSGKSKIGLFDGKNIEEIVAEIPNDYGQAYFGCRVPLELTKSNDFYLLCGGGDGPSGSESLYRVNLESRKLSLVKQCISNSYPAPTGGFSSKTTCN